MRTVKASVRRMADRVKRTGRKVLEGGKDLLGRSKRALRELGRKSEEPATGRIVRRRIVIVRRRRIT